MRKPLILALSLCLPVCARAATLPPEPFYDQSKPILGTGPNLRMAPIQEGLARLSFLAGETTVTAVPLAKPVRIVLEEKGEFLGPPMLTLTTGAGDEEHPALTEVAPGIFIADVTPVRAEGTPVPGNQTLEVGPKDTLWALYNDGTPGDGKHLARVAAQAKIFQQGKLEVMLADGAEDPTYVAPKTGQLLVRVLDSDEDTDGQGGTDALSVPFTTTSGDKGLLRLKETQIPGRFEALMETSYAPVVLDDPIAQTRPGDHLMISYVDFLGEGGGVTVAEANLETAEDARLFIHQGKQEVFSLPFDEKLIAVLADADADTDGKGATDVVVLGAESYRGDMERLVLNETDTPGEFAAAIKVGYGLPLIADGKLTMVGADSANFTYDDRANVRPWAPLKREWVYDAADTAKLSFEYLGGGSQPEVQAPGEAVFTLVDRNLDEDGEGGTDIVDVPVRAEPSGYEEVLRFRETATPGRFEGRLQVGFVPQISNSMAVEPGDIVQVDYVDEVNAKAPGERVLSDHFRVVDRPQVMVIHRGKTLPLYRLPLGETALVVLGGDGLKYWNNAPGELNGVLTGPGGEKEQMVFKRRADGAYESELTTAHAPPVAGDNIAEVMGDSALKLKLDYGPMPDGAKITLSPGMDGVIQVVDANGNDKDLPNLNYAGGYIKVRVSDLDQDTDLKGHSDTVVINLATGAVKSKGKGFRDSESIRLLETALPGVFEGLLSVSPGNGKIENRILSGLSRTAATLLYDDSAPLMVRNGGAMAWVPYWEGRARYVLVQGKQQINLDGTGKLRVSVQDPDLDKDGKGKTEQVKVRLTVPGQDQEQLVLAESDLPGVFEGSMPYVIGQWFDKDGSLQFTGMEPVLISYVDPTGSEKVVADTAVLVDNPTEPGPSGPSDDLFMVALVDVVGGDNHVRGAIQALNGQEDVQYGHYQNGRVSLYAIGKIKAHTLFEASYDSDRTRRDDSALSAPAPDAYYPVYGDTSSVDYSAVPLGKLYVKVTRKVLDFLVGDYNTAIDDGEFISYARQLSGLRANYTHRKLTALAFAAKVGHSQALDRIQGQGTSGPYKLCSLSENQSTLLLHQDHEFGGKSGEDTLRYDTSCRTVDFKRVVDKGETVVLETRKRDHPEVLLGHQELKRYIDYTVDLESGAITLKQPLSSVDADRNPQFLVVRYEYEVKDNAKGDQVAGARLSFKAGKTSLTAMGVVEDGRYFDRSIAGVALSQELPWKLGHAEYESSWSDEQRAGVEGWASRFSWQRDGKLALGLNWMDMDAGFSDSHLSFGETGTTKLYTYGRLSLTRHLALNASRSETETAAGKADETTAGATYSLRRLSLSVERQEVGSPLGESAKSTGSIHYKLTDSLTADVTKTLYEDEAGDERDISQVGLTWQWDERTQLYVRHVEEGLAKPTTFAGITSTFQESRNRRSYLTYQLLSGASGVRNAMLVGTQQRWRLTNQVGANLSFEQGLARDTSGVDQDNRAMAAGLEWTPSQEIKASVRAERKDLGGERTTGVFFSGDGQFSKDTTVFARFETSSVDRRNIDRSDLLFGLAYRSSRTQTLSGLLSFRRKMETAGIVERISQTISAEVGSMLDKDLSLTLRYSLKDADFLFSDGIGVRSRSDLWLARVNKRISTRWDAQSDYSILHQRETHTRLRNYGSELGYSLPRTADSTRIAVGYHWLQFSDEDYAIRAVEAKGPYFRLNVKY